MRELIQQRWSELSVLLDAALDLAGHERAAWIAANCPDPDLAAALNQLIADSERDSVLDAGSDRVARALISDSDSAASSGPTWIGRRLGVYRLCSLIGEGGMASVFLAERDDGGFAQQVAIKVLRQGMLDPYEQRRFLRERQILARLEHPHIARLIDGGLTDEGVPWFAMEYVEGVAITSHCDSQRLDIEARLALFLRVCDAVDYAHRALVVHRDLKPSNILVGTDGTLKLLDFGIARLIDDPQGPTEELTVTVATERRLTPAYAAPEQWRGEAVTTTADVYALGVLLHELLTGLKPARRNDATLRLPSAVLATAEQGEQLAQNRSLPMPVLRRRLAGDLDMIVQQALRAESERRYPSVSAFAEDVRRHGDNRPVLARPDSWRYRAGRYLRRHSVAAVAAGLVLVSIATGVVATLRQAEQARSAAARAEASKRFLIELFESNEPGPALDRVPDTRTLLDRGAERARREFAQQPELRADLLLAVGQIYRQLGEFDKAQPLLEQADQAATGDAFARLQTQLELARLLKDRGDYAQADARYRTLIAQLRDWPADPEKLAEALKEAAIIASRLNQHDRAQAGHREALALLESTPQADPVLLAGTLNDLATALGRAGKTEASLPYYERALTVLRSTLPAEHADLAQMLSNVGVIERRLGRYADAERHQREAVAMDARVFAQPHPDQAQRLNNLAKVLHARGHYAQAAAVFERSLASYRNSVGLEHPGAADPLANFALLLSDLGEYPRARELIEQSIAAKRDSYGADHPMLLADQAILARIHLLSGDLVAAETTLAPVLAEHHRRGSSGLALSGSLLLQARLRERQGRLQEAADSAADALTISVKAWAPNHPLVLADQVLTARLACLAAPDSERLNAVAQWQQQANAAGDALPAPIRADAWAALSDCLAANGRHTEAVVAWRQALALRREFLPVGHPQLRLRDAVVAASPS